MARPVTPNVSIAVRDFLDRYLKRSTSATAHTDYRSTLNRFTKRVGDCHVGSLTPDHVEDFFYGPGDSLSATCSASTMSTQKTRLKPFLVYCHRQGWLRCSADAMLAEVRPKRRTNRNRYRMDLPELRRLIDAATDPRDRALVAFVANTGVRISEALAMNVEDVNFPRGELYVTLVKTNTEETLPMTADLEGELRRWLVTYEEQAGKLERRYALFPPYHKNRFTSFTVVGPKRLNPQGRITYPRSIIQKVATTAGIELEPGDGWHTVRRSFARIIYEGARTHGYDDALRITQAALNHAKVTTTERYLGLDIERQRYADMMKGKVFLTPDIKGGKIVPLDERRAGRG
jgi:integrase